MSKLAKFSLVALACLGMASASAQSSGWSYHTDPATGRVTVYTNSGIVGGWDQTVGNNSNSFKYAPGGSSSAGGSAYQVVKPLGNGLVLEAPGAAKVPKTNTSIPIVLKRSIPAATIAKGIFKALPVISTAYAIGNLLEEIGCELSSDAVDPVLCYKQLQGQFTGFFIYHPTTNALLGTASTSQQACQTTKEWRETLGSDAFRGWKGEPYVVGSNTGWCYRDYYFYDWSVQRIAQSQFIYKTENTNSIKLLPASEAEVSVKLYESPPLTYIAPAFEEVVSVPQGASAVSEGLASSIDDTTVSLPGGAQSVQVGQPVTVTTTTTNTAGDTITKNETTTTNATTNNNVVNYTTTTVTTTTNNTTNITTTETTQTKPTATTTPDEIITCGLPGTPACKIDETGTPEADSFDPSLVDSVFQPVKTCLQDPLACLPALPDLSWAFTVPTSCTAIPVNGFGEYISEIDICPFQSIFHDLMSMIWAAVGVFAAAQMLFRDSAGSA